MSAAQPDGHRFDPVCVTSHRDKAHSARVKAEDAARHPIEQRMHLAIADAHEQVATAVEQGDAVVERTQRSRLRDLSGMLGDAQYARTSAESRSARAALRERLTNPAWLHALRQLET